MAMPHLLPYQVRLGIYFIDGLKPLLITIISRLIHQTDELITGRQLKSFYKIAGKKSLPSVAQSRELQGRHITNSPFRGQPGSAPEKTNHYYRQYGLGSVALITQVNGFYDAFSPAINIVDIIFHNRRCR